MILLKYNHQSDLQNTVIAIQGLQYNVFKFYHNLKFLQEFFT